MLRYFERHRIAKCLFYVFILSPAAGISIGILVAVIAFYNSGYGLALDFAGSHGVAFGGFCGFTFGILTALPLWNAGLIKSVSFLGAGTLLFSLPVAFMPEIAVPFSWFTGMAGYWTGFLALMIDLCINYFLDKRQPSA